jgi:hypothetical protein
MHGVAICRTTYMTVSDSDLFFHVCLCNLGFKNIHFIEDHNFYSVFNFDVLFVFMELT